jgi:hypothetical protein
MSVYNLCRAALKQRDVFDFAQTADRHDAMPIGGAGAVGMAYSEFYPRDTADELRLLYPDAIAELAARGLQYFIPIVTNSCSEHRAWIDRMRDDPDLTAFTDERHRQAMNDLCDVVDVVRACHIRDYAAESSRDKKRKKRKGMTKEKATIKAMELAEQDKGFLRLGPSDMAERIGCSVGLIYKIDLLDRAITLSGRRRASHPRPKVITLTPQVENSIGRSDESLHELLRDQANDFEESPLVETRKKTRTRRAL